MSQGDMCPWAKCPVGKCPGGLCPVTVIHMFFALVG